MLEDNKKNKLELLTLRNARDLVILCLLIVFRLIINAYKIAIQSLAYRPGRTAAHKRVEYGIAFVASRFYDAF